MLCSTTTQQITEVKLLVNAENAKRWLRESRHADDSVISSHAFLEEARSIFFLLALRAEFRQPGLANDAFRVEAVIERRTLGRQSAAVIHDGEASLDPITTATLLHRVLTRRQRLDARHDNVTHDSILTAECRRRDARQLLLVVQRLFAAPVENVTIRFCRGRGREIKKSLNSLLHTLFPVANASITKFLVIFRFPQAHILAASGR